MRSCGRFTLTIVSERSPTTTAQLWGAKKGAGKSSRRARGGGECGEKARPLDGLKKRKWGRRRDGGKGTGAGAARYSRGAELISRPGNPPCWSTRPTVLNRLASGFFLARRRIKGSAHARKPINTQLHKRWILGFTATENIFGDTPTDKKKLKWGRIVICGAHALQYQVQYPVLTLGELGVGVFNKLEPFPGVTTYTKVHLFIKTCVLDNTTARSALMYLRKQEDAPYGTVHLCT